MITTKPYDILVVGSGLYGATFANLACAAGKRCLIIEKREHLGGNVYCEPIDVGNGKIINVHKYGAHIFHTNDREVWNYVNSFVEFNNYINCPLANFQGKLYNLPFNLNTFYQLWGTRTPEEAHEKIEEQRRLIGAHMYKEPANLEERALSLVGADIYEKFIKYYTEKQWGRKCSELPAFIISRLPLRFTFNNNYFNDRYQGVPIGGYNLLIEGMLCGCQCLTSTDFFASEFRDWKSFADTLVYSGPLDEFFRYRFGKLEWRTVELKNEIKDTPNFQGNAVINYTGNEEPYTRIIEHKHFEMFGETVYACPKTVISVEYPVEYREGLEPFYPINDERNNELVKKYSSLFPGEEGVIFGGRLGNYKYYDMAPVIRKAMDDYLCYENKDKRN